MPSVSYENFDIFYKLGVCEHWHCHPLLPHLVPCGNMLCVIRAISVNDFVCEKKTHVPKSLPSHENYELGAQQQNRNVRLQLLTYNNINLTLLLHHNFKRHIRWCSVHFALKASFS